MTRAQLIKERAHPLDLVRELLSNAGATEVGASRIDISYTKDREGHIFEIADDGCGMDHTGNLQSPGRLDKFLGLGLSGIIGIKADEFSWKGLGSKLAFQSRRVEIDTCAGGDSPSYSVRINEPWETINNNRVPKPRISEHPPEESATKIRVVGHPPHRPRTALHFPCYQDLLAAPHVLPATRAFEVHIPKSTSPSSGRPRQSSSAFQSLTASISNNCAMTDCDSTKIRPLSMSTWNRLARRQ